ncbi:sensor histidine kinase [Cellulomonas sp.]|uniref:sensor histidine kinase n=1 Tax=Cellulomonas sp. TaxID=40001 RepID=UPI003BAA9741
MSDTASTATDPPPTPGDGRARADLYLAWLAFAGLCTALMWAWPGNETIPYHLAWAAFALLYALGNWPLRWAVAGLSLCAAATGAVLLLRASTGYIPWQETTEIPLMTLLVVLGVWHVRRRQLALRTVTAMAQREHRQAADRERLTRLTSHEMRTPLTIARGYVELLLGRVVDPGERHDLSVIDDELSRLTRATERLVRAIRFQGGADLARVDVDALLRETADRWGQVADRHWVVDTRAGEVLGSGERLRACLDTLIENALRYTTDGDTVRLSGTRGTHWVEIAVADSGPGLSADLRAAINGEDEAQAPRDELSQTGLGLGLVRDVVTARGGRVRAGVAPERGALVAMQLPVQPGRGAVVRTAEPGVTARVAVEASGGVAPLR